MRRVVDHLQFRRSQTARGLRRSRGYVGARGWRFAYFGDRTLVRVPAMIEGHSRISFGSDVYIGSHSFVSVIEEHLGGKYAPELRIGNGSQFGDQLFISCCGQMSIGEKVLASARVFIADTYHDYADPLRPAIDQPLAAPRNVTIKDGVFLGIGCFVLPGVTIGERAYVAAAAVVTKDVPPLTVVAGNPARPIQAFVDGEWRKL